MIIREANMNDLEELLPIYIEGYKYHLENRQDVFSETNELILRDNLIECLGNVDDKVWILIDNDKLVGYLMYKIKSRNNYRVLWIDEFVISESFRHQGYGRKLMDRVYEIAKDLKVKRIELSCWSFNTNALEMYKKMGYSSQRVILEKDIVI